MGHTTIQETVRKVLLTFWNAVSFQSLYARTNNWTPNGAAPAVAERPVMDRWLVAQRNALVADVTEALEDFDTQRAGPLLADFVDDLSNWYVRRSRRRFWDGQPAALWTLHETLDTVTRLMAPMAPFITERVWQDLVVAAVPDAPESVHLAAWPTVDDEAIDADLIAAMRLTRRLVELGRGARSEAQVKTRQPLRRVLVPSGSFAKLTDELVAEIAAELNVGAVESFASAGDLVDYSAKGNFRALGKRFGKDTPKVAAGDRRRGRRRAGRRPSPATGEATVDLAGGTVVTADEVIVSERPREGWSVVNEQGETVALDLELTPELVRAGLVREVVRMVQDARKRLGPRGLRPDLPDLGGRRRARRGPARGVRSRGRRGAGHLDRRGGADRHRRDRRGTGPELLGGQGLIVAAHEDEEDVSPERLAAFGRWLSIAPRARRPRRACPRGRARRRDVDGCARGDPEHLPEVPVVVEGALLAVGALGDRGAGAVERGRTRVVVGRCRSGSAPNARAVARRDLPDGRAARRTGCGASRP